MLTISFDYFLRSHDPIVVLTVIIIMVVGACFIVGWHEKRAGEKRMRDLKATAVPIPEGYRMLNDTDIVDSDTQLWNFAEHKWLPAYKSLYGHTLLEASAMIGNERRPMITPFNLQ